MFYLVLAFLCGYSDSVESIQSNHTISVTELPIITCNPGDTYNNDCNVCVCSKNHTYVCTKMACSRRNQHVVTQLGYCKPGTSNLKDCNRCFCVSNRVWVCSDNPCDKKLSGPVSDRVIKLTKLTNCKDEGNKSYFRKGCSVCHCQNGLYQCEKKSCNDPIWWRVPDIPSPVLPAFSEKSLAKYPELPSSSSPCTPGKVYRIDCNPCVCLENGDLTCGQMKCLVQDRQRTSESNFRIFDESIEDCIPGMKYKKDCNSCYCFDRGQLRCSNRLCTKQSVIMHFLNDNKSTI